MATLAEMVVALIGDTSDFEQKMSGAALGRVFEACQRLNGLTEEASDAAASQFQESA